MYIMTQIMKAQEQTITIQTIDCWYYDDYYTRTEEQMLRILVDGKEESLVDETGYDVSGLELQDWEVIDEYELTSPNKERTEEIVHTIYQHV